MIDTPRKDNRLTQLDPGLLATPFNVQTNWHVFTGAPCSGKSTLIDQLANRGFRTVPEGARLYIEQEMLAGRSTHPIRDNAAAFQRRIKDIQLSTEAGLRAADRLLLDGAVPASLAWYRAYGLNPNEMLLDCFHHRYASVFILAPLPFRPDGERVTELISMTGFLDEWQTRDFLALGYSVVRVPVLPPDERLAFVLDKLSKQGLSEPDGSW